MKQYIQLPFSILRELFNLTFPDQNFVELCVKFFSDCMLITENSQASSIIEQLQQPDSEIKYFIGLVRKCHAPVSPRQPPKDPLKVIAMRKANYLEEAGITIRPSSIHTSVCSLRYSKGLLEIPKLRINYKSSHLFRNLMEHEIQHYPHDTFIIDYLNFMASLIDTAKDVDVLIHNEILHNSLTDNKEVASLFNSITKEAPFIAHNYYYHGISEAVNAFCQIPRHRWKAALRRDYCSSPWMVASTIAAIILLVLTFIQTVCSILSAIK